MSNNWPFRPINTTQKISKLTLKYIREYISTVQVVSLVHVVTTRPHDRLDLISLLFVKYVVEKNSPNKACIEIEQH